MSMSTLLERSGEMNKGDEDADDMESMDAYEGVGVSKSIECEPIVLLLLLVLGVNVAANELYI